MDDGVKHRLSNVIAWAGFVAASLTMLVVLLCSYVLLIEIPAKQADLAELQATLADLKQKFDAKAEPSEELSKAQIAMLEGVISDSEGAKTVQPPLADRVEAARILRLAAIEINEAERRIELQEARIRNDRGGAGDFFLSLALPPAAVWLLLGLLNYIFFGAFRALPWKRIEQAEVEG